jgi:hypothetical protein
MRRLLVSVLLLLLLVGELSAHGGPVVVRAPFVHVNVSRAFAPVHRSYYYHSSAALLAVPYVQQTYVPIVVPAASYIPAASYAPASYASAASYAPSYSCYGSQLNVQPLQALPQQAPCPSPQQTYAPPQQTYAPPQQTYAPAAAPQPAYAPSMPYAAPTAATVDYEAQQGVLTASTVSYLRALPEVERYAFLQRNYGTALCDTLHARHLGPVRADVRRQAIQPGAVPHVRRLPGLRHRRG